jgi:NAD(P)-dependent dehydrogenase (short-subunit alcohol dehydrogenase family)
MAEKYKKLANRTILKIGGSSGVGYAVAEACLALSANIIMSFSLSDKI